MVKVKNLIVLMLLMIAFIFLCSGSLMYAKALNIDFETETFSIEKKEQIWKAVNVKEGNQTSQVTIASFAVNISGQIALGFTNKSINIYNRNGDFIKNFSFNSSGSYNLIWDDSTLIILLVRSDVAIGFNIDGEMVDIVGISNSQINNDKWNEIRKTVKTTMENEIFELSNDLGIFNVFCMETYSILKKYDTQNNEMLIYDATVIQVWRVILLFVAIILSVGVAIFVIKKAIKIFHRTQVNEHSGTELS